jgi:hypothetical protein
MQSANQDSTIHIKVLQPLILLLHFFARIPLVYLHLHLLLFLYNKINNCSGNGA